MTNALHDTASSYNKTVKDPIQLNDTQEVLENIYFMTGDNNLSFSYSNYSTDNQTYYNFFPIQDGVPQNYIYLFGYPIDITNPNGIFLLKIAQVQFSGYDQYNNLFQGDLQFARLFCLIYSALMGSSLTKSLNKIFNAFCMFYIKYYEVQPLAVVEKIVDNLIYYTYTYKNESLQQVFQGTIDQICTQLYLNPDLTLIYQAKAIQFIKYALMKNYNINISYLNTDSKNYFYGFVIPSIDIYYYNQCKYLLNEYIYTINQNSSELRLQEVKQINSVVINIENSKNINITISQQNIAQEDDDESD